MNGENEHKDTFTLVGQEGRIARTSRMIGPNEAIPPARKDDIRRRVNEYLQKHDDVSQATVAKQTSTSRGTVSDVLRGKYGRRKGKPSCDDTEYLRRFNNWMELDARRRNIVQNREFVDHGVARDIITVAEIVSETCKIGVAWGPAQIGKSFTARALEGSDRLGNPKLFTMGESKTTPKATCRMVCHKFGLPTSGTFDAIMRGLVTFLEGTKRMLMFDEVDCASYRVLEWIRELHDATGCGVLLLGKPAIYQKLGFRDIGDFREVTDQLASRVVIRRDLTERTRRADRPEPLFSKEDIRKLIKVADLHLKVSSDAVDWLQDRACVLGMGGFGMAVISLYLAYKFAVGSGSAEITAEHLEAVEQTTLGHEEVERLEEVVTDASGKRIRRFG